MKTNYAATAIVSALLLAEVLCGQAVTIESNGVRAIHDAARALEEAYGWRITYEDPPYTANETKQARAGVRLLVPDGPQMEFSFSRPVDPSAPAEKLRVLGQVLRQHSAKGNSGHFASTSNGDFIHIFPTTRTDETGSIRSYLSLLHTNVEFPAGIRTIGEIVETVLQQVSEARGTRIEIGSVPAAIFGNESQNRSAYNETAEDVLAKTFEQANNAARASACPRGG